MKFERINGEHRYGVKVVLGPEDQIGCSEVHHRLTRGNPEFVERCLDRMESDLSQQLSEWLLTKEIK